MPRSNDTARNPNETTKLFLIREHYLDIAEFLKWDVNRLRRLCSALQLTEFELGAYIRVHPSVFKNYMIRNQFPHTVELHLSLIEHSVFPSTQPTIFPAL